ncbi:tyrosine-type recombinase/integrase [Rhizobium sp. UGM030330-04]|uniref:tyrosine-type recombinase/integrase n=1 Tax=Pseudomonadota TaxID=1224 RepID=UPI000BE30058|nr:MULTISPECIES: tyrosine-type recombinase/integrase [Pseudomonadota]PYG53445.1 integrase/recombinase XerD [Rhizobium sp. UGM030330-04]
MSAKRPIDILTPAEVRKLINQCSRRAPTGIRDAALIAVLYRCGLRISEALALYERDINGERGTIRIHDGKGHKPRTVGLDNTAFGLLDLWFRKKDRLKLNKRTTPIFCTLKGDPIASQANIRDMLKRRAKKAGIDKRVHPHGLRHTHAMELIADEKTPLNALQKQLGHGSLATTSEYVDHLGADEVIEIGRDRAEW